VDTKDSGEAKRQVVPARPPVDALSGLPPDVAFAFSSVYFALSRLKHEATDLDDERLARIALVVKALVAEMLALLRQVENQPRVEEVVARIQTIRTLHRGGEDAVPQEVELTDSAQDALDTLIDGYSALTRVLEGHVGFDAMFETSPQLLQLASKSEAAEVSTVKEEQPPSSTVNPSPQVQPVPSPHYSSDGSQWWDGFVWRPAFSDDRKWRWNGTGWEPVPAAPPASPQRPRPSGVQQRLGLGGVLIIAAAAFLVIWFWLPFLGNFLS